MNASFVQHHFFFIIKSSLHYHLESSIFNALIFPSCTLNYKNYKTFKNFILHILHLKVNSIVFRPTKWKDDFQDHIVKTAFAPLSRDRCERRRRVEAYYAVDSTSSSGLSRMQSSENSRQTKVRKKR